MASQTKARLVGINHVALEVADIDAALDFYGQVFEFELRGRHAGGAFIDMGDQFLALMEAPGAGPDDGRHFGLVVDDRSSVEARAEAAGATILPSRGLDFLDPWGNRVQVVEYRDIQFTKTDAALAVLGAAPDKSDTAMAELRRKGLRPEGDDA